ncbi:hypothetical protein LOC67_16870 [Stieleria sp. JC731]|uniref:hypothetical protein n=1 Tax=Stieleria sp. JC731 TaxID=2894195 RepID=UPI001E5D6C7C|nr:hypothetical protein [Stieleria sp. JC731]MCC9602230.1 hypothetical protein [Stieleria sp. JC731]
MLDTNYNRKLAWFCSLAFVFCLLCSCSPKASVPPDPVMETRFDTLADFLHPSTNDSHSLEEEFCRQPYTEGLIFTADTTLDALITWYRERFAVHILERHDYDPGQATIYFHADDRSREVSICLADRSVNAAVANLTSYIPSPLLAESSKAESGIVGVVFMEDINQTIQRMKDNGEWPPG